MSPSPSPVPAVRLWHLRVEVLAPCGLGAGDVEADVERVVEERFDTDLEYKDAGYEFVSIKAEAATHT